VLDDDSYGYRRAQIQAGIDPDLTVEGLEPSAALAHRYERPLDLSAIAAEAGLPRISLETALTSLQLGDRTLVPRLREGSLTRAEANMVLIALRNKEQKLVVEQPALMPAGGKALKLTLWTDSASYKPGDLMTVSARASAPCHLTLISVNAAGKATVLFPSEFDPDNLVGPDAPLTLPGDKAQYQFRLKDPGAETLVAQCQTGVKLQSGVEPDYERQRFTVLGSYENFLRTSYSLDGELLRQRPDRSKTVKSVVGKDPKEGSVQQTARSAVRIVVR
jgi:hypothetical protein